MFLLCMRYFDKIVFDVIDVVTMLISRNKDTLALLVMKRRKRHSIPCTMKIYKLLNTLNFGK